MLMLPLFDSTFMPLTRILHVLIIPLFPSPEILYLPCLSLRPCVCQMEANLELSDAVMRAAKVVLERGGAPPRTAAVMAVEAE